VELVVDIAARMASTWNEPENVPEAETP
jgi:hypothetical protein